MKFVKKSVNQNSLRSSELELLKYNISKWKTTLLNWPVKASKFLKDVSNFIRTF